MTIGEVIKYFRKKSHLTQEVLSEGICSIPYLSKLENNQLEPSNDILLHLCKRLDLDPKEIENITSPKILEKLLEWNALINQERFEEALLLKDQIELKKDYISSQFLRIYYDLFSLHLLLKSEGHAPLQQIEQLSASYAYMDSKQRYHMRKIEGIYYYKTNDWHQSASYFQEAVLLGEVVGLQEADVYYSLAIIYSRLRKFLNSNQYIKKCELIYQKNLDYKKVLKCKMMFAINNLLMKEYQLAREDFEKILTSSELESSSKSMVLHNIGVIYYNQNDFQQAEKAIIESMDMGRSPYSLLKSYYFLSLIYCELQQDGQAIKFRNLGITLVKELNNAEYHYKFQILDYKYKLGPVDPKWELMLKEEVVPFFKKFGDKDDYIQALSLLGEFYYEHKKYKQAADIYIEVSAEALS
ncbi:helix-turn-helix domain-containing protein [Planomicrobium okeanokoites]|uniref:Tetratricopeptide repeat protein n=1 Tax=Planomicrobium okeanokoites TaxID=244 RepID=A0ABV7KP55_PLAOK|nr:helix-turn-helix transcriptional regulator [Planomicrobium okeanokoites]TAA71447.1 XRE family transcriptional regulator [Planomicrobium okeanokoites]